MKTPFRRFKHLPRLIVSVAVVLISTAGFAAIKVWYPAPGDSFESQEPSVVTAGPTAQNVRGRDKVKDRANGRCAECGVIVSMREINGHGGEVGIGAAGGATDRDGDGNAVKLTAHYEIDVRMADGTSRVIKSGLVDWRPGERVIVIAGSTHPHQ